MKNEYLMIIDVDYYGESGYRNSECAISEIQNLGHDISNITADDFKDFADEWSNEAMANFSCDCDFTAKIYDQNADPMFDEPLKTLKF